VARLIRPVVDAIENKPTFKPQFIEYLDINTAVNTVFGSTVATDADNGTYGTF
jgi:hypothetical protein